MRLKQICSICSNLMFSRNNEGYCLGLVRYPGQDLPVETQNGLRFAQRLNGKVGLPGQVLTAKIVIRTRVHQETTDSLLTPKEHA